VLRGGHETETSVVPRIAQHDDEGLAALAARRKTLAHEVRADATSPVPGVDRERCEPETRRRTGRRGAEGDVADYVVRLDRDERYRKPARRTQSRNETRLDRRWKCICHEPIDRGDIPRLLDAAHVLVHVILRWIILADEAQKPTLSGFAV